MYSRVLDDHTYMPVLTGSDAASDRNPGNGFRRGIGGGGIGGAIR
jgi:hypothetical protein